VAFYVSKSLEGVVDEDTFQENNKKDESPTTAKAVLVFENNLNEKLFFKVNEIKFGLKDICVTIQVNLEHLELLYFSKVNIKNLIFSKSGISILRYEILNAKFSSMINEYLVELTCDY